MCCQLRPAGWPLARLGDTPAEHRVDDGAAFQIREMVLAGTLSSATNPIIWKVAGDRAACLLVAICVQVWRTRPTVTEMLSLAYLILP